MSQREVEILEREVCYQGFYRLERLRLRHRLFAGGMSPPIVREVIEKGDVAAVLLYDPKRDEVVMIEQFRIGARDDARTVAAGDRRRPDRARRNAGAGGAARGARGSRLHGDRSAADQQLLHQSGEDLAAHAPLPRPHRQFATPAASTAWRTRARISASSACRRTGVAAGRGGADRLGLAAAGALLVRRPARNGTRPLENDQQAQNSTLQFRGQEQVIVRASD
jgi:hypothetical protein